MSGSNCCFLTCMQISQEAGQLVWYSHLLKNFPQFVVIHTTKGFSVVNEAEVDFFWNSLAFYMIKQMLTTWSLVSLPSSKSILYIWEFLIHVLLKTSLKDFEDNPAIMWNEGNCTIVWTFFGIAFLWDWNENWPFPALQSQLSFPNLLTYWVQHFNSIIFENLK